MNLYQYASETTIGPTPAEVLARVNTTDKEVIETVIGFMKKIGMITEGDGPVILTISEVIALAASSFSLGCAWTLEQGAP